MKRLFSFLLAFLICFYFSLPSVASEYTGVSTIYSWMAGSGGLVQKIIGYLSGSGCPDSSDGRHHASSYVVDRENGHYTCVCSDCGHTFVAYEDDLEEAESEYVASLPAQVVNNDGSIIWSPTINDFETLWLRLSGGRSCSIRSDGNSIVSVGDVFSDNNQSCRFTAESMYCISYIYPAASSYNYLHLNFRLPFSGTYNLFSGQVKSVNYHSDSDTDYMYSEQSFFGVSGDLSTTFSADDNHASWSYSYGYFYLPKFSVTLISPYNVLSSDDNDTYNIGTRAASITGNYGVVNSNGTVTQIESQSIVNEGDSTVYNPITNETHSMADWSYDYSDRSYHVTTEQGDTLTVTYGDENVTIQEGDNVYNVYYITNSSSGDNEGGNSGSGETPLPAHTHNYSSDITTAPTCTLPGVWTFTCSCGASYTQQIAPAGHTWEVKNHVNMEYDAEGELIQQGYTVYRCSVCGEEYRSPDDSLPPGLMETDNQLAEVSNKVQAWYNSLRELYQGYVGFLTDAFRFLPDELVALIEFGIGSSFVIAVSKKLLR